MKYCPKCDTDKKVTDFYKVKSRSDGRSGYCKECVSLLCNDNYHAKAKASAGVKIKSLKSRRAVKQAALRELNKDNWDIGVVKSILRQLEREHPIKFQGNKKYAITEDDMKELVWAAAKACHTTPDGVYQNSKVEENVIARGFVAKELYERGVTHYTIGKLLNGRQKRDIKNYIKNTDHMIKTYNYVSFDYGQFKKLIG